MRLSLPATLFASLIAVNAAADTLVAHLTLPNGGRQWAYNPSQVFDLQVSLPDFEPDETIVPSLTYNAFKEFVNEHDIAFINFCNDSGPCNFLAAEWEAFAEEAKDEKLKVAIASVNCKKEVKLCQDEEAASYPLLRWYDQRNDVEHNYNGAFKTTDDLLNIARSNMGSSIHNSTRGAMRR